MRMISGSDVRCVLPWKANVGECPVWHSEEHKLYWVDILEKHIHRFDPRTGENETFTLPDIVPCIALRRRGGLVLTLRKKFAFYEPTTQRLEILDSVEGDQPENRFNDGKCDPRGRFWAGTMDAVHWDQPVGHLFRLDAQHKVTEMQAKVICSNGTGWSPDVRTMYYTESFRYTIFAYDFDAETGTISRRRPFVQIDKASGGFPDGLAVDAQGYVWSCIVGLGQIHRYDPSGRLERMIQLPVPRATACAFGDSDLKTLYITSSYETLTPEQLKQAPLSGSLFAVYGDVPGMDSTAFVG